MSDPFKEALQRAVDAKRAADDALRADRDAATERERNKSPEQRAADRDARDRADEAKRSAGLAEAQARMLQRMRETWLPKR